MTRTILRTLIGALAISILAGGAAHAQLFGQPRTDESELVARMARLENQLRQLTGMVEELQHRNQQLEQQLQRAQQDNEFRFQEMNPSGRPPPGRGQGGAAPSSSPPPGPPPLVPRQGAQGAPPPVASAPAGGGSRRDVFDPAANPDAPGVPRPLGSVPAGPVDMGGAQQPRTPGAPLDLGPASSARQPAAQPPLDNMPAGRGGSLPPGVGAPVGQQQAALGPSGSAREDYDVAFGAIQRRDYDLAVQGFRVYLSNHGSSREPEAQRLTPEAYYWMGEAQFQLKQHSEAAESFLKISTDYPNAVRAPEALLRLGQSLAELGERETACASLGHVLAKYPNASGSVRRAVEQEQKRVRC